MQTRDVRLSRNATQKKRRRQFDSSGRAARLHVADNGPTVDPPSGQHVTLARLPPLAGRPPRRALGLENEARKFHKAPARPSNVARPATSGMHEMKNHRVDAETRQVRRANNAPPPRSRDERHRGTRSLAPQRPLPRPLRVIKSYARELSFRAAQKNRARAGTRIKER